MRNEFHPAFFPYVSTVSQNCLDDFVVVYSGQWSNRTKWADRAAGRLLTLGWFSTMTKYKGHHVLYVTRAADRTRWANLFVSLAAGDSIYSANLYESDGLGYSGPGWYGLVRFPGVNERALDKYIQTAPRRATAARSITRHSRGTILSPADYYLTLSLYATADDRPEDASEYLLAASSWNVTSKVPASQQSARMSPPVTVPNYQSGPVITKYRVMGIDFLVRPRKVE